jgi:hypothetical protein
MSQPKRLTVEYDDGSTKTVDFSKVDKQTREALTKLGVCPPPALVGNSKNYVLLQWDDWQEVMGLDTDTVDLLRYYVIRRIDDRGRLSFEVGGDNPELFVLERLPKELRGIIVTNAAGIKAYDLSSEVKRWEGIFEAGGKIEYVKYDKTDSRYQQALRETGESVTKLWDALSRELTERSFDPAKLIAAEEKARIDAYGQIAKGMGIRGKEKQEDVYGFINLLIRKLAASQTRATKM